MASFRTGVTKQRSMPNFPKYEHFLPPDMCVSGGKKCSFFGKFGVLCFDIRSFALLRTISLVSFVQRKILERDSLRNGNQISIN